MYWIDPIIDRRWTQFVEKHPQASVFHTAPWLEALRRTYGYTPMALTSCGPGSQLMDGIPFCKVKSWISGSRLVSLPFSDHCRLLVKKEELPNFISYLDEHSRSGGRYIEIRPTEICSLLAENGPRYQTENQMLNPAIREFSAYRKYSLHRIDLLPDLPTIFNNFHKSCIQRKIRRAEREELECEAGRSDSNLETFYRLLLITRRRHGLPPQPISWFRNLRDCFGESLTIRIASKNSRPVASILTLRHKNTAVYKYGCSDSAHHNLGAMPMLFWKTIEEEKGRGVQEFDLGRSDPENAGLAVFKEHLGAVRSELTYFRIGTHDSGTSAGDLAVRMMTARTILARMPRGLAEVAGTILYRHMG